MTDPQSPTPTTWPAAGAVTSSPTIGWVLASLSLSMLMPALGTSIANVALPTFSLAFGASFQAVQWVVLAYLLATTTLVVSVGKLGDLVGRRRLLVAGISLFSVASMACALAPTLWLLVAARAAQGAGAAVMMALTITFVGQTVPKARAGSAMGLLGTMSAIGTALGPSLGGLLIAGLGWQAIFAINLPLGIGAVWLARRHLPRDRPAPIADGPRFDLAGKLVLALTLAAYALAMTTGGGRFGLANLSWLAAAIAGIAFFVWVEARVAAPLLRLTMFRDRSLRAGLVTSLLVSTVVMSTLVVGPFYLSRGLRLDTVAVGLVMSIGPLVAALAGAPAGRLVDRIGAQRVASVGLAAMAVGCLALFATPASVGVFGYGAPIAVVTAGYAAFQAANNTAVMASGQTEQRGLVSGLLTLSRNLGLITGASLMGAAFALASGTVDLATAPPEAVARGMRFTFALASLLIIAALAIAGGNRGRARAGVQIES